MLYKVFSNVRAIKSDQEIELMKKITEITCEAHIYTMKKCNSSKDKI